MGEGFFEKNNRVPDTKGLTAKKEDVAEGKTFYSDGDEKPNVGTLKNNASIVKKINANEEYVIPYGIHNGDGYVYQEIPFQEKIIVNPVAEGSIIDVGGKYMTDNIIINGIENLLPQNIRKGAFIGKTAGEWEGYVNNDILTPYWYGIFAPGQTGRLISNRNTPVGSYSDKSVDWFANDSFTKGQYINFKSRASNIAVDYPAIRFNVPLEMSGVKSISLEYALPYHSANNYTWVVLAEKEAYQITSDGSWNIASDLGLYEKFVLPGTGDGSEDFAKITFNINNASMYHWIYIGIGVAQSSSQGRWMKIRYLKLNK